MNRNGAGGRENRDTFDRQQEAKDQGSERKGAQERTRHKSPPPYFARAGLAQHRRDGDESLVIRKEKTCWFDMSNPLWDVKEAGRQT
ncbi:hypothetical protein DAPPUDRAFT_232881 [Daphnia pulex]|uniref:Uncharacterized protein n=1 Tax=Daphnia pulex TaxID=6669 RepID=E9FSL3_DAPPU|nr:hypothetical protein DAPPUDRAFT_232881 [Daphnia pulex]|eukprot:EFX89807.1 hypothetical protein DAPPUDRAFT_232881 [Daphnia pulex]